MTNFDNLKMIVYESGMSEDDINFVIDAFEKCDEDNIMDVTESVIDLMEAYESKDEELITEKVKIPTEAKVLGCVALISALLVLYEKIQSTRIKKGYEKDPELAAIKKDLMTLKGKISASQSYYNDILKKLLSQVKYYNDTVKAIGAPTITTTSVTRIPENYHDAEGWHTRWVEQRTTNIEQNINYDPEKVKPYEEALKQLKPTVSKYENICDELMSYNDQLEVLKKKLDKIAKTNPKKDPDKREGKKQTIRRNVKNTESNYNKLIDNVDESVETDMDEARDNYRKLKLAVYESGLESDDIESLINMMESCDEDEFQGMCESVEDLLADIQ